MEINGGCPHFLNDLTTLRGASIDDVIKLIPENWTKSIAKDGKSTKFINPDKKGEQIIIEKGHSNPSSPTNIHAGDYLRVSRNGKVDRIPLKDNPSLNLK